MVEELFWKMKKGDQCSKNIDLIIKKDRMFIFFEFKKENGTIESGLVQLILKDEEQTYTGLLYLDGINQTTRINYSLTGHFESWESFKGTWVQEDLIFDFHFFICFAGNEKNWPTAQQNEQKRIEQLNYKKYRAKLPKENSLIWDRGSSDGSSEISYVAKSTFIDNYVIIYYQRDYYENYWRVNDSGFIHLKKQLGQQSYQGFFIQDGIRRDSYSLTGQFTDDSWTVFKGVWTQNYEKLTFNASLFPE